MALAKKRPRDDSGWVCAEDDPERSINKAAVPEKVFTPEKMFTPEKVLRSLASHSAEKNILLPAAKPNTPIHHPIRSDI